MNYGNAKYFALGAYLFSFVGALYVLFARRNDKLAVYHARQSLGLALFALAAFIVWVVLAWLLTWIPYVGFILGMALFSLVIAAYLVLFGSCLAGMKSALHEKMQPVPIFGNVASRLAAMIFR